MSDTDPARDAAEMLERSTADLRRALAAARQRRSARRRNGEVFAGAAGFLLSLAAAAVAAALSQTLLAWVCVACGVGLALTGVAAWRSGRREGAKP